MIMHTLQTVLCLFVIWFAISFAALGVWILLCIAVRQWENVKNYKHVCYLQRRKELRDFYRKDNDEGPVLEFNWDENYRAFLAESRWGQLANPAYGHSCWGDSLNGCSHRTRGVSGR